MKGLSHRTRSGTSGAGQLSTVEALPHLDLFVEVRSPPGYADDGAATEPTQPLRPHDVELAATLDRAGLRVELGRWGVRAERYLPGYASSPR